jgi:hypothetical protein
MVTLSEREIEGRCSSDPLHEVETIHFSHAAISQAENILAGISKHDKVPERTLTLQPAPVSGVLPNFFLRDER